jgi:1-acyl-sn-glycerol-3-phosphate acyltransferase
MLPENHGAVIVCNHRSSVDPLFIQLASRPVVSWMVAAEYFQWPVFGTLLRFMQAIPTRRGGIDTASTRTAIRRAAAGQLVGLLPEGRINETSAPLLPGRGGAVLVAHAARVPIVPCYIHGAPYDGTVWGCFFTPARVRLIVGEPIDLSPHYDEPLTADLQAKLTLRMMRSIARLGGHDNFEPTLAGRNWKPQPNGSDLNHRGTEDTEKEQARN